MIILSLYSETGHILLSYIIMDVELMENNTYYAILNLISIKYQSIMPSISV